MKSTGEISRRAALSLVSAGLGASLLFPDPALSAGQTDPPVNAVLPFTRGGVARPGREVFAHWHFFPVSMDNKPSGADYYATEFLDPENAAAKSKGFGSLLRERPLPRPPRAGSAWGLQDMEGDIRWALEIGVDAFLYNIFNIDPKSPFLVIFRYMLDAAAKVGSAFRVVPSLDATLLAAQPVASISAAIKSFAGHPMLLRRAGGQLVLGAFGAEAWTADRWTELFADLAKSDIKIEFMPTFLNVLSATPDHLKLADAVAEWSANYAEGVGNFQQARALVKGMGKPWCSPVWPQDFRPKDGAYGEAANSRLFRDAWMAAINGEAERVQLITWNDYSESSAIRPSTGIQYSFHDLAAYYIEWFKTAQEPKITRDVLYYFHRIQPAGGAALGTSQAAPFKLVWGSTPVNEIELLAFLVRDGELQIEIAGELHRLNAPAGLTSMRVPLAVGRPSFRLKRGEQIVIDFASAFAIDDRAPFQNLLYHGGSSTRPPVLAD